MAGGELDGGDNGPTIYGPEGIRTAAMWRKSVASGHIDFTLASIEPLAMLRSEGLRAKNFYTAYQGNVYGLAVPADSPIKSFA